MAHPQHPSPNHASAHPASPLRSLLAVLVLGAFGTGLAGQSGPFRYIFSTKPDIPGKDIPIDHWVDVTGDGRPDAVGLRPADSPVSEPMGPVVGVNLGGGRFQRRDPPAPPKGLLVIIKGKPAFGDLDGDGDADLVVPVLYFAQNNNKPPYLDIVLPPRNHVMLNDGKGNFSLSSKPRLPANASVSRHAALGDVDGDGDLDILVVNELQQSELYVNDGKGFFVDATKNLPVDSQVYKWSSIFVDVDADGDLDVAVACGAIGQRQQNSLYINDGKGRFKHGTISGPVGAGYVVAAGDIDGDKDVDLVFSQFGTAFDNQQRCNYVYLNDGKGNFKYDVTRIQPDIYFQHEVMRLTDFDEDGDLDLVEGGGYRAGQPRPANSVRVQLNDGKGTFTVSTALIEPPHRVWPLFTMNVLHVDLDEDGDPDLAAGPYVWLNARRQILTDQPVIGKPATLSLYCETNHAMTPVFGLNYKVTDLGSLGTLYMDPATMWFGKPVFFPSTGVITQKINVPNDSKLIGLRILTQGLDVFGPASNPQLRLTTAMWDTIR